MFITYDNNNSDQIENLEFNRRRTKAMVITIGVVLAFAVFFSTIFLGFIKFFKSTDSYKTAIKYIESQSEISSDVGGIVGYGFMPNGNIQLNGGYGNGHFNIKVKGQKKNLTVYIDVEKKPGCDWTVTYSKF